MAIKGKVIPPNVFDILIQGGKASQDFLGFLNNLAKTAPISGSGSPEGAVEAAFLTFYTDIDAVGTPGTFLYQKSNESGNTGWKLV